MTRLLPLFLIGFPMAVAAAAQGADPVPAPDVDAAFRLADLDGDGKVSLAEAAGNEKIVTRFDRSDRNRDGRLTRAEFERVYNPPKPRAVAKGKSPSASVGASKPAEKPDVKSPPRSPSGP